MTLKEFNPQSSTGDQPTDLFFRSYVTGPNGARYELFKEKTHTAEDVERAKKYLYVNFDPVHIAVVKET